MICHKVLKCQDYVTSFDPKHARSLFKARLGMLDIKYNFKRKYHTETESLCPVCASSDENLQHVATSLLNPYNKIYSVESSYDMSGSDTKKLRNLKVSYKYEKIREYIQGNIK